MSIVPHSKYFNLKTSPSDVAAGFSPKLGYSLFDVGMDDDGDEFVTLMHNTIAISLRGNIARAWLIQNPQEQESNRH